MTAGPIDPLRADAAALTRAYAAGLADPESVAARLLDEIARRDPAIRAFVDVDAAGATAQAQASAARWRAGRPLGPLEGVPIAVKSNIAVAGLPCAAGTGLWRNRIAAGDAVVVSKLKAAGVVLLGTLNMHEGALGATSDNPFHGRCQNPLRAGFTPGGSSGGSGAAVAAGFVPIALGTDTMGSVRIPAAYCGVTGLKPTAGLVSLHGVVPLSPTLDTVGPLARSPDDLATVMAVLAGDDPQDPMSRPVPPDWQPTAPDLALNRLRLGVPTILDEIEIEPALRRAFEAAVGRLAARGARVAPIAIAGWEPSPLRRAGLLIAEAEAADLHPDWIAAKGGISDGLRAALIFGRDAPAVRLAAAQRRRRELAAGLRRALADVDALILPTAPQRAFAHDAPAPADQADLTAPANLAGLPAVTTPLGVDDGGLPAAFQCIGRPFAEAQLLALAACVSDS